MSLWNSILSLFHLKDKECMSILMKSLHKQSRNSERPYSLTSGVAKLSFYLWFLSCYSPQHSPANLPHSPKDQPWGRWGKAQWGHSTRQELKTMVFFDKTNKQTKNRYCGVTQSHARLYYLKVIALDKPFPSFESPFFPSKIIISTVPK